MGWKGARVLDNTVEDRLRDIVLILERGQMTNFYKFALLRALAVHGKGLSMTNSPIDDVLSYEWLAEQFVAFYFPLAWTFRVRQSTDPAKDPIVMNYIRSMAAHRRLSINVRFDDFCTLPEYSDLIVKCTDCRSGCFRDVVPRFHNVASGRVPLLF